MSTSNKGWAQDFDALSRQYWNAWSEIAAQPGAQASHANSWQQMLDLWAPWARDGRASIDSTVERMSTQAGAWFGQMQQLAQQFAGTAGTPASIAKSWKDMFGGSSNPFADMFTEGAGPGAAGIAQWMQQMEPMLDAWKRQINGLLGMPAFGMNREQQERTQALMKARLEYQQAMAGYAAVLLQCGQRSFAVFEGKLAERSEPGRQIDSARGLFDLWIDSAEEAWNQLALSAEYREAYANLANAQTRVRAGVQDQVERMTGQFGIPTRTEVNSSHRKVTQLEREVRELKQRLAALETRASRPVANAPAANAKVVPSARVATTAAAKSKTRRAAPSKPVPRKSAPIKKQTSKKSAPATRKPVKPVARRASK